jgi:hypothetical protein
VVRLIADDIPRWDRSPLHGDRDPLRVDVFDT